MNSSTIANTIPAEMAALPQWVTADHAKVPHSPRSGNRASPTNPTDWGTFSDATDAATRRGHRIGFCLTSRDPFVLIDLDNCRAPLTGTLEPWATDILARFPGTYAEISVSGTGIHIVGMMSHPLPAGRRKGPRVELYDDGRYVVMTGDTLPGQDRLGDITAAVVVLHAETFPPAPPRQPQLSPAAPPAGATLEDTELIERARGARNGAKFDRLWGGDLSGHAGDESAADLALLSMLAFWTSDPDQLDRLFRLSGLYRDKWERLDYRERTIARALERSETYTAPARPTVRPMPQDAALGPDGPVTTDDLPDDLTALKLIVLDLRAEVAGLRGQVDDERSARLAAEARAERSARLRAHTTRALGNPHLGQERVTAVAVAYEMEANEAAGTPTDADGFHRLPLTRLAERAGTSTDTASRHIRHLADLGALDRKVITVTVDRETGEILRTPRLEQWVRPRTDAAGFIESVATLVPAKPKPQWGGLKTCPDHPGAKIVKRTTVTCADCGRVLLDKSSDPMLHPAMSTDSPMPHLAASATEALPAADSAPDPAEYRGAVDVSIGRKSPAPPEWAGRLPASGTIAAEWMTGGRGHPPGEPGHDQWTH